MLVCLYERGFSHMNYAISSWYWGTTADFRTKLQRTQNKVIRFVLGKQNITKEDFIFFCLLDVKDVKKMYKQYSQQIVQTLC